jgi:hypothetical protein
MSYDPVAFLDARLGEQEAAAWSVHDVATCDALLYEEDLPAAAARTPDCDCGYPARVLREVNAKRAILRRYKDGDDALYVAVLELASAYSDHPDYQAQA